MPEYGIYKLDGAGHIASPPIAVECAADEDAIEIARQYLDGQTIEVWRGAEVVERLTPKE